MESKMITRYKELRKTIDSNSDTTAALILIAEELYELTSTIKSKTTIVDGEQIGYLRTSINEISQAICGVGQMVDNLKD